MEFGETIKLFNGDLPYIGLANVESEFGNFIPTDEESPEGTCRMYEAGQVLYGKLRPYLNKVHIPHNNGQCSTEFYCLTAKDRAQLSHEFLAAFLISKPFLSQTVHMMTGNTHPRIQREDFEEIVIPLPPLDIQQILVKDMEAARATRKQKLAEADALLAGVDGFVLQQLGLVVPQEEKRLAFAVRLRETLPARMDSHFYKPYLRKTEEAIADLPFQKMALHTLLDSDPINGIDAREYLATGQRYLRVQNVRPYELLLSDVKYVASESTKDVSLKSGDVLLTRKGTFGVATAVPSEAEDCLISSEIILLRLRQSVRCLPDYLVAWLNNSMAQRLLERYKTGGIMGHITQDVVSEFPVPLPPLSIQQAIADEITHCREQARRLRDDANTGWQAARTRFEVQLLGEV